MRKQAGFTLIELILTMVIMGIILTVGSMFFASLLRGVATSRTAAEIGPAAQLAMDRMAIEIKNATNRAGLGTVGFTANTNFIFESNLAGLTGTRTIQLVGTDLILDVDGTDHLLIEDVTTFTLALTEAELDGNAGNGNEISSVDISFQVTGYGGTFTIQVAPREFLRQ